MPSDTQTNEPKVTNPNAWGGAEAEGQVIELPSGNYLRCRRSMDLLHLLKSGRIPNPLSQIIQKMIDRGGEMPNMGDMDDNAIGAMLTFVDDTVIRVVTEPKVVAPPKPNENEDGTRLAGLAKDKEEDTDDYSERIRAWMDEERTDGKLKLPYLSLDDRMFIFVFSQGFAADLATFRDEQAAGMASVSDVPAVPAKSSKSRKSK